MNPGWCFLSTTLLYGCRSDSFLGFELAEQVSRISVQIHFTYTVSTSLPGMEIPGIALLWVMKYNCQAEFV